MSEPSDKSKMAAKYEEILGYVLFHYFGCFICTDITDFVTLYVQSVNKKKGKYDNAIFIYFDHLFVETSAMKITVSYFHALNILRLYIFTCLRKQALFEIRLLVDYILK